MLLPARRSERNSGGGLYNAGDGGRSGRDFKCWKIAAQLIRTSRPTDRT